MANRRWVLWLHAHSPVDLDPGNEVCLNFLSRLWSAPQTVTDGRGQAVSDRLFS